MQTIEYKSIDMANWPDGPWKAEPDKKQWQDEETGLPCLIKRHPKAGHLCGYVGVSPGHPLYQVDGYMQEDYDIDVHGGLTYSAFCQDGKSEEDGICHVPGQGEEEHVWWLGFDCAHCGDHSPAPTFSFNQRGTYKDLGYVEQETRKLAQQLATIQ